MEERKTQSGYTLKVRPETLDFSVFHPNGTEELNRNGSNLFYIPRVVFLGNDFDISHLRIADINYLSARQGKIQIPYQHGGSNQVKNIQISTETLSDLVPVQVFQYDSTPNFIKASALVQKGFTHLISDESLPKNDMVSIKIRFPNLSIFIQKRKS
jgi:hypothetical protein